MFEFFKKRNKKVSRLNVKLGVSLNRCDECPLNLKPYFSRDHVENFLFMKCEKGKILVSKSMFKHLIDISNPVEIDKNYEFEFVDKIDRK